MNLTYSCPVKGCGAPLHAVRNLTQDGTGATAQVVECDKRPSQHRWFLVEGRLPCKYNRLAPRRAPHCEKAMNIVGILG